MNRVNLLDPRVKFYKWMGKGTARLRKGRVYAAFDGCFVDFPTARVNASSLEEVPRSEITFHVRVGESNAGYVNGDVYPAYKGRTVGAVRIPVTNSNWEPYIPKNSAVKQGSFRNLEPLEAPENPMNPTEAPENPMNPTETMENTMEITIKTNATLVMGVDADTLTTSSLIQNLSTQQKHVEGLKELGLNVEQEVKDLEILRDIVEKRRAADRNA